MKPRVRKSFRPGRYTDTPCTRNSLGATKSRKYIYIKFYSQILQRKYANSFIKKLICKTEKDNAYGIYSSFVMIKL